MTEEEYCNEVARRWVGGQPGALREAIAALLLRERAALREERDAALALAARMEEAWSHCRSCQTCGDGPCCYTCQEAQDALSSLRSEGSPAIVPCVACKGSGRESYMVGGVSPIGDFTAPHYPACRVCHGSPTSKDEP